MRLALDNQVGYDIADKLVAAGHEVVYHAGDEHDELWLNLALDRGAQVYISPDYDVENFALNRGLEFIRVKQRRGGTALAQSILSQLKKLAPT